MGVAPSGPGEGRHLHGLPASGVLSLLAIYLAWGSTYLAIRVAVREGAGWGPFWMGAARVLVAALVLLALSRLRGARLRPTRVELLVLAGTGVLMWVGGNGLVNWAEQRVDSGLAALVVGTAPLSVAAMEAAIDRKAPSRRLVLSLVVGFAGLVVLSWPVLRTGVAADMLGVLALAVAGASWGLGSIVLHRRKLGLDSLAVAGWQQLAGGLGFAAVALSVGEQLPRPTPQAWGAWGYLTVMGSLVAFSCFVYALKVLPTSVVMTYAYVNPAIAVVLGWLILDESITGYTFLGMALILAGVWGVFRDKLARR
ncbi:MAG TPA: EamA family transporter [Thermoanaerobaculales bacterium]|nr:EamA family transporter [Thermoanaerobaculales bacterium]HPA81851.1 EamA family transporter [Thermoanaerobaculales bacterium]HQL30692.1 EamA family transporter [Thermoanaerobaculales bacterium]HQN96651.1 EamA family transporter [Thermoanaerobaculales bacterium]HQP43984.1 EamA family transporter [Thermoanaerobaculales bacterium]